MCGSFTRSAQHFPLNQQRHKRQTAAALLGTTSCIGDAACNAVLSQPVTCQVLHAAAAAHLDALAGGQGGVLGAEGRARGGEGAGMVAGRRRVGAVVGGVHIDSQRAKGRVEQAEGDLGGRLAGAPLVVACGCVMLPAFRRCESQQNGFDTSSWGRSCHTRREMPQEPLR